MNNEEGQTKALIIENVAEWFVAVAGLVYATGFLVVLTFSDYIGTREATTDFFRAKFLHVGVLCLALPVIIVGGWYGVGILKQPGMMPAGRKLYGSAVILTFNLLFTFYTFLMFAPPGYMRNQPYLVLYIFGVTLFGLIGIESVSRLIKEEHLKKYQSVTRWVLCAVVVLGLDYYCFQGLMQRLGEILWPRGIGFLLFVASIAALVYRLKLRSQQYTGSRAKLALWVLAWCILAPMYFLTVLSFAYTIYPNIPASRGGGDFSDAPTIILHYIDDTINQIPSEINQNGLSQPLVLIEEAEHWIIVADPQDAGGPTFWRRNEGRPQGVFGQQGRRRKRCLPEPQKATGSEEQPIGISMRTIIFSNARRATRSKPVSIGKFGGADHLRNAVNQLQSLLYAA